MFKMEADNAKHVFLVVAGGFFTMEEGGKFVEEYQRKIASFKPEDYTLIVDAKEVKASSPEVADALQSAMVMYISVPFKKRFMVKLASTVAQSQVVRLGKSIPNFDLIEFVDTVEDAIKKI